MVFLLEAAKGPDIFGYKNVGATLTQVEQADLIMCLFIVAPLMNTTFTLFAFS